MKNRIINKITLIIAAILVAVIVFPTMLNAAGSYSASLSASTIYVGGKANVIIKTNNAAGKFNVTTSNSEVAKVSTMSTWVDGSMDTTISVTGVKAGTATITITPVNVSDDEYNLISTPKYLTITVKEKSTNTVPSVTPKSSDATLKSIELTNGSIDFKSSVTKYTVYVDKTVTTLGVKATANSSKAKVEIIGDKSFGAGTNVVMIKVTAEDGTVKTYEIDVIKSKYGSGPLLELGVKGYEIVPEFDPSKFDYALTVIGESELEVEYTVVKSTTKVEVDGNTNMKLGKNVITVTATEDDGTVTVYTINVTVNKSAADIEKDNDLVWKIIILILVLLVVIETVYIIVKRNKEDKK